LLATLLATLLLGRLCLLAALLLASLSLILLDIHICHDDLSFQLLDGLQKALHNLKSQSFCPVRGQ